MLLQHIYFISMLQKCNIRALNVILSEGINDYNLLKLNHRV